MYAIRSYYDYVTKPFSLEELVLRMEAVLRRTGGAAAQAGPRTLGEYVFVPEARTLTRDGDSRRLTDKEAALLELLSRRPGETLDP